MAMGYQEGKDEVADNKRKSRESWRKYGAERRKELVAKDETLGGTRFEMHKKCSVEKYFRIAEKAISDFRLKCEDVDMNVEEIYVMGHRLKAFLGHALPQHPHYMRQQVAKLRSKSLQNLTWIKDKMHELAIKIDEEQLDSFVTLDFEPEPDDVSTSSSEPDFDFNKFEDESASFADFSSMGGSVEDQEWHSFTGWGPLEFPSDKDLPPTIETDSSSSQGPDGVSSWDGSEAEEETPFDFRTNTSDLTSDNEEEPQAVVTFQDEEEEDDDDDDDDDGSRDGGLTYGKSDFLRQIANEAVCYESDSEAVDSWAQDGASHSQSIASSGTAMTCDPARIALREILINAPKDQNKLSRHNNMGSRANASPPPPSIPSQPPRSILTLKRVERVEHIKRRTARRRKATEQGQS
mmetsp:Transcript_19175/g.45196  ORF Transcript_19175/g.45196 Transcript_19175/m.45196 type:complete len:407 (-) Transcript_19175:89-1309(-)